MRWESDTGTRVSAAAANATNCYGKGGSTWPISKGKKLKQVIDPTIAKAFTHPLRGHVWVTLFEQGETSPTEIADELDLKPRTSATTSANCVDAVWPGSITQSGVRGFDEYIYEAGAAGPRFRRRRVDGDAA